LEHFACHGKHHALSSLVTALLSLPTIVPRLKSLEVKSVLHLNACVFNVDFVFRRYVEHDPPFSVFPVFPIIPANLESITIEPAGVADEYYKLFAGGAPSLRGLRFGSRHYILPLITPLLMGKLTHLELYRTASSYPASFPFELVLRNGTHLESLLAENLQSLQTPSVYFRRYSHSLPHLKRFGISFSNPVWPDCDLFPAICDFLHNKSGLVTLELIGPSNSIGQQSVGFGKGCWDLLPALVNLRCLSMTLTKLGDGEHCTQFIPRSVTSLTLLGKLDETVISAVKAFRVCRETQFFHKHFFRLAGLSSALAKLPTIILNDFIWHLCTAMFGFYTHTKLVLVGTSFFLATSTNALPPAVLS
jgi:hypothetical protein